MLWVTRWLVVVGWAVALVGAPRLAHAEDGGVSLWAPASSFRLSNGLEVTLQPNAHQSLVAVVVAYEIGSRDEPAKAEGLAHLVEHLSFRGSKHLDDLESFDLLKRAGAVHTNAATALDSTVYEHLLPANALELALWIESERMAFTLGTFDSEKLNLERAIVRTEASLRSNAEAIFGRLARGAFFGPRHPYSKSMNSHEGLGRIDLDDVRFFFQQGYRPSNARLIVIGNFQPPDVRRLVKKYFGPIRNPSSVFRRSAPQPARPDVSRLYYEVTSRSRALLALWDGPRELTREETAAGLALRHLGIRLNEELTRAKLALSARFHVEPLDFGSVLALEVQLESDGSHPEVEKAVARHFGSVASIDWQRLLPGLRRNARFMQLRAIESPLGAARAHLRSLRTHGKPFRLQAQLAEIDSISEQELRDFTTRLLGERALVAHMTRARANVFVPEQGRVRVEAR